MLRFSHQAPPVPTMRTTALATAVLAATAQVASALSWGKTEYLMVFGDSYTTTGYNISAGINSPTPGWTSSNGWNWVQYLGSTFNVTATKVYNLAYGGAVTSNKLVTPYLPTVINFDQQTQQFLKYLTPPPAEAPWSGTNTLFAVWIGINDVGNSWYWNNVTQAGFHSTIMDTYFTQLSLLYAKGARSFLLLTVPPIQRAPLFIQQGPSSVQGVETSVKDYNKQLAQRAKKFAQTNRGSSVQVYDTSKVFNTLLNNADELGYVNVTGYADPYANGVSGTTYQAEGYAPVSSYFWLNSLHPVWPVHAQLAHGISTFLST